MSQDEVEEQVWLEEARRQIAVRRAEREVFPQGRQADNLEDWEALCRWMSRHGNHVRFMERVPQRLQPLLGSSPQAIAVRKRWERLGLLPLLYQHDEVLLRGNWQELLAQLRALANLST